MAKTNKAVRIGVILLLIALPLFAWLKSQLDIDRCLDSGGRWDYEKSECDFGGDALMPGILDVPVVEHSLNIPISALSRPLDFAQSVLFEDEGEIIWISWDAVSDAAGYEILRSEDKNGPYRMIAKVDASIDLMETPYYYQKTKASVGTINEKYRYKYREDDIDFNMIFRAGRPIYYYYKVVLIDVKGVRNHEDITHGIKVFWK